MARSPSDATRFTATGPYASSSSTFSPNPSPGSQINLSSGSPSPASETPQQKIARLRAAAAASRAAQHGKEPTYDRVVRIGRIIADRAHRGTAYGLIGLTVVSGMVAVAGISDMLLHNRRRRNEWMAEQKARSARDLAEAVEAAGSGTASEDQMLLINRERAAREAEERKNNRPGVFKRTTGWLFGGLSQEEQKGGRLGAEARGEQLAVTSREELLGEKEEKGVLQAVEEHVAAERRSGERVEERIRPAGGPLDGQAERVSEAAVQTGRGWTNWLTGR